MKSRIRHREKGSVIIMVVGVVVILGMLGSTFLIVSFMDRQESRSIATAVPMKVVARGVVERICDRLWEDLYFSPTGFPYGSANRTGQMIDYIGPDDKHLASHRKDSSGHNWPQITDLGYGGGPFVNVRQDAAGMVDTDGDATYGLPNKDSRLIPLGCYDRKGRQYYVAVRVIDASGRLNANLCGVPFSINGRALNNKVPPYTWNIGYYKMPIVSLSLAHLPGMPANGYSIAQQVHQGAGARGRAGNVKYSQWHDDYALSPRYWKGSGYRPYDMGDMMAVAWRGDTPTAATGRLKGNLGSAYKKVREHLTTWSASRIRVVPNRSQDQTVKADLNWDHNWQIYTAFYNLLRPSFLTGHKGDMDLRRAAAQMMVNVLDYRDADSNVNRWKVPYNNPAEYVYGVERQPFITEAAFKREGNNNDYYGIEIFNPYMHDLNLSNWQLQCGGGKGWNIGVTLPAGGRLVVRNNNKVQAATGNKITVKRWANLDLSAGVKLLRPCGGAPGGMVVVDDVQPDHFGQQPNHKPDTAPAAGGPAKIRWARRDDNVANAVYSLAAYQHGNSDLTDKNKSNLGKANGVNFSKSYKPCPIYVRDKVTDPIKWTPFLNVAEVGRILTVGPGETKSLVAELTAAASGNDAYIGRLSAGRVPDNANKDWERLPPLCLVNEWFTVNSPFRDQYDNDGNGFVDAQQVGSSGNRTLTASGSPNWATDQWKDQKVWIISGPGVGAVRKVMSNTHNTLTTDGTRWGTNPTTNSRFIVGPWEDTVYGKININTASRDIFACLPTIAAIGEPKPNGLGDKGKQGAVISEIIKYRDQPNKRSDIFDYASGVKLNKVRGEKGFATPGEILLPLLHRNAAYGLLPNAKYGANAKDSFPPNNYKLSRLDQGKDPYSDDGLNGPAMGKDSTKWLCHYAWISNHLTVRSDTYIAYIRVQIGDGTEYDVPHRSYVAVIDRSNVASPADVPAVLMFSEIKN